MNTKLLVKIRRLPALMAIGLSLAVAPVSADFSDLINLPDDWLLHPIESQLCVSNKARGRASGIHTTGYNSYLETSSKFLTWVTGTLEQAEYEPIGEVANYFGFAAMRSELRERNGSQGDTHFRGAVFREILELLDNSQRALLYDLVAQHRTLLNAFLEERLKLIHEIWGLKEGSEMDFSYASKLITMIGMYEAEITVSAARTYGQISAILTAEQREYLNRIRTGDVTTGQMQNSSLAHATQAEAEYRALEDFDKSIMQEVTSKLISWVTGDIEDAMYLPPGKIGNFFGFANYRYLDRTTISRSAASSHVDQVLHQDQRALMCSLSWSVSGFTADYIEGRAELINSLAVLKSDPSTTLDTSALSSRYANLAGVGEGRRAVVEALTFHLIEASMSEAQIQALVDIRRAN